MAKVILERSMRISLMITSQESWRGKEDLRRFDNIHRGTVCDAGKETVFTTVYEGKGHEVERQMRTERARSTNPQAIVF